jgi:hypothetical protein
LDCFIASKHAAVPQITSVPRQQLSGRCGKDLKSGLELASRLALDTPGQSRLRNVHAERISRPFASKVSRRYFPAGNAAGTTKTGQTQ